MFFMRLRRGAKWVFVLLIFAFAFGFLFSGVGGGSGSSDIIQQLLGMRGGNPVKSAEKAVKQNPGDAAAWNQLAILYQGKGRQTDAIKAYERYLKLKPNDLLGLSQVSNLWREIATQRYSEYALLAQEYQSASNPLGASDPLQKFIGASDPLRTAYNDTLSTKGAQAYGSFQKAARSWEGVNLRYLNATPANDKLARAQAELQLGDSAQNAADMKTAIKAYKEYLRLVPGSKLAPEVRKALAAAEKANASG
jgi:tetratricopeptide (TPR) repeat protein